MKHGIRYSYPLVIAIADTSYADKILSAINKLNPLQLRLRKSIMTVLSQLASMLTSLDPHSNYLSTKNIKDLQLSTTR